MLIWQKNSFKLKDEITNVGFALSLTLIMIVFFIVPVIIAVLGFKEIHPLIMVLMPSAIIIPGLCMIMYFVGRPGRLLRKFKMIDLHRNHISFGFIGAIVALIGIANIMYIYLGILKKIGVKLEKPVVEEILKNSEPNSLWIIIFAVIVLAPISEEIIFRRFIFGFLAPRCGLIIAMVITAALFAAIHMSLYSLPALFLLGIAFQLIYLKFGSIYPAIIMHAFNNAIAVTLILLLPQQA